MMREQETGCAICDDEDAYTFAPKEPPPEFLCCLPADGSDAKPIGGPICAECAKLTDTQKANRIRASLERTFPGAHERRPH